MFIGLFNGFSIPAENMTDGWVDCPSLGPGWKRREVLRKSGTRSGHSDTYYISPRGEKIRSRVELLRLLGCSRDLTDFDYRRGIFVEPNTEALPSAPLSPTEESPQRQIKKSSKKHLLHLAATTLPSKKRPYLHVFLEPQPSPGQGLLDQKPSELELEFLGENQANMQSQQSELPVTLDQLTPKPRKQRCRQHLPPIPAPDKIEDVLCQLSGTVPRNNATISETLSGLDCGMCQACKITEDCGTCAICLRRQRPGMKRQWKCLKRRCLKRKKKVSPKKDSCSSKKDIAKWKPTIQRDPGGSPLVRHRVCMQ
ncbi:hypothetical protein E2320_016396 [Naja naja]|nr:hypothetical protein E2320_016396 [Naja naja]